jgi:hypothetical protein
MPEALQGASSRIASKARPSHQAAGSAASAASVVAWSPRRRSVSSTLTRRAGSGRVEPEAAQRLVDLDEAGRVAIDGEHLQVGELEQVRGLAAGRGAGVEDARA